MTVGNVTAVPQRSVKRMLAYSSIAHAGYALIGLVAAPATGGAALLFYLAVYALHEPRRLRRAHRPRPPRRAERGRSTTWRASASATRCSALAMTVFMLSLAGFPPTAGFAGKFYLFSAAVDAGYVGLVVIARR